MQRPNVPIHPGAAPSTEPHMADIQRQHAQAPAMPTPPADDIQTQPNSEGARPTFEAAQQNLAVLRNNEIPDEAAVAQASREGRNEIRYKGRVIQYVIKDGKLISSTGPAKFIRDALLEGAQIDLQGTGTSGDPFDDMQQTIAVQGKPPAVRTINDHSI